MENKIKIYHNSRCSKSRCAIAFLEDKKLDFEIIEYLKEIPSKAELTKLIKMLGINPKELIRKGEPDYKANFKGKELTDSEWIDAMIRFPKLIERPIVTKNNSAVIARPAERIDELV